MGRTRARRDRSSSALRDKVVVVTGAASGIGRALAQRCGLAGAKLGLLDLDHAQLETVVAMVERLGAKVHAVPCDVASAAQCERAINLVVEKLGAVDVLINNAGITHLSAFTDTDVDVFRRVMDVNFFGALHCTKAALPSLIRRRGVVAVLSSVAGFAPLGGRSGYAASKHALHGLFESLRAEQTVNGVHVLIVCPGFTRTSIGAHALGAHGDAATEKRTMTGKEMAPEDVAGAICLAIVRRRRLLVLSPVAKVSYLVSRLWPSLYERIMIRRLMS